MFWSRSAYTLASRGVTLSFRPNKGLSCRLSSMFGEGSHLFPPIQGSRQIFTTLPKASELCFFNDTPKAEKCEHSSSQLLGSPCERGSGAHFVGIKCLHSDWLSPCPFTGLNPWFKLPLSPTDKGSRGEDTCKEPDYALEAGSRRRIWGIRAMWRLDFSRCKSAFVLADQKTLKIVLVYLYYSGPFH